MIRLEQDIEIIEKKAAKIPENKRTRIEKFKGGCSIEWHPLIKKSFNLKDELKKLAKSIRV